LAAVVLSCKLPFSVGREYVQDRRHHSGWVYEEVGMRLVRVLSVLLALVLYVANVGPASGASDVRVTRDSTSGSYVRYDGQVDDTMAACSTGRRVQNEPSIAIDPSRPQVVVAGSNDYCAAIVNGDLWAGYYRSTDGGTTWTDSLVPGYPEDTSPKGQESPTQGSCSAAGDPSQSFDGEGRLFYAFICFNRVQPGNGSIYVATYSDHGSDYKRTVRVARGTPSTWGLFQDKINLVTDPASGNVYVAWVRYPGQSANNTLFFSRSTDHGRTFSDPIAVAKGLGEKQFADMAVGPDGNLYLAFRTFDSQGPTEAAAWLARSTNGGLSFNKPRKVANFEAFSGDAFGATDCGDGPFACESGLTYSRFDSVVAVAADAEGVHVVWTGRQADGQAKTFVRNSPDGLTWPTPKDTLDDVDEGHQWFPDIASGQGVLTVVFYDSRVDPAYSPDLPPGNTADGKNSGDVVNTFVAQSDDGGVTWDETQITTAGSNMGWETSGARRIGFAGDYNYVSAVGNRVSVAWTDTRDLIPGSDPRETGEDEDSDGFDVYQPCTYEPNDIDAATYESPEIGDPCLSQGGLDQNIYTASL
jgi:hypothetical protein